MRLLKTTFKLLPAVIILVSALQFMPLSHAQALSGSDFKPGRIIDDVVFTNKSSMTVAQIQAFLNSKIPTCDTNGTLPYSGTTRAAYAASSATGNTIPFICLNQFYENPNTTYPVTHTYINTSGVTVNNTYNYHQNNYYRITGFTTVYYNNDSAQGVKSVRPIYQNLGGVIPAGAKSAAQLIWDVAQIYNINPQVLIVLLQKEQGLVTDDWAWAVQYEKATGYMCPDTAPCDATKAGFYNQIENSAWQFRHDIDDPDMWVPYGANALGLNNIRYNPNTACGTKSIYIENKATAALYKYTPYTPNDAALANLYGTGDACSAYGNRNFWRYFNDWFGPTSLGLVSTIGGGVYLIEDGFKRAFPNEIIFLSHYYKWSSVQTIAITELSNIPNGPAMEYNTHYREGRLVNAFGGGVFLVDNGKKRPIPNIETFYSNYYKWSDVLTVTSSELSLIPDGTILPYNVNFRNGRLVNAPSQGVFLIENGQKRAFPSETIFLSYGYKWSDVLTITTTELSLIPSGTILVYNINNLEGRLVASFGGGVFLVDNGKKRPIPNIETFYSNYYKWSDVLTVTSSELSLIPDGTILPYNVNFRNGRLVNAPSQGVFLIENGQKRAFPSETIFLSYGYKWSDVLTITTTELSLIPSGTPMI